MSGVKANRGPLPRAHLPERRGGERSGVEKGGGSAAWDLRPRTLAQRRLAEGIQESARATAPLRHHGAGGSGESGVLQRLALADQPFPNLRSRPSLSIMKSGAGGTGVYFAREGEDRLVVKFVPPEEAFGARVADEMMALGGEVRVAGSRIFAPGTRGNVSVRAAVRAHQQLAPPRVNARLQADVQADTADGQAVVFMEHLDQFSLSELAQGRTPASRDDDQGRLLQSLRSPAVARGFARILVVDALAGNSDRFMKDAAPGERELDRPANLSNIFVSPSLNGAVALDNAVERAGRTPDPAADMAQIRTYLVRYLAQRNIGVQVARTLVKSCLLDAGELPPAQFPTDAYRDLTTPLATLFRLQNIEAVLARNLTQALNEELLPVLARLRARRNALRGAHGAAAAEAGVADPSAAADYDSLRARAKMLKELRSGKSEEEATRIAAEHVTHKREKTAREERTAAVRTAAAAAVSAPFRRLGGLLRRDDD